MAKEKKEEKKIIVDEDWKQQAKQDKEVLAAQEETKKEDEKPQGRRGPLPKGDFAALISMLVTQASFALGLLEMEGQTEKEREPDLGLAKYNIDMLETLEEKTKNNLTEDEVRVLTSVISQIRMAYVKAAEGK